MSNKKGRRFTFFPIYREKRGINARKGAGRRGKEAFQRAIYLLRKCDISPPVIRYICPRANAICPRRKACRGREKTRASENSGRVSGSAFSPTSHPEQAGFPARRTGLRYQKLHKNRRSFDSAPLRVRGPRKTAGFWGSRCVVNRDRRKKKDAAKVFDALSPRLRIIKSV